MQITLCTEMQSTGREQIIIYEKAPLRGESFAARGVTVIEDCYNASPESMAAALDTLLSLAKERGGRPLALLGGMRELGEHAEGLHRALGHACAAGGLAYLFPFGKGAWDCD